jgi:arylsulfatase
LDPLRAEAREGSPNGSVNENKFFNNYPDDVAENLSMLDKLGSPDTYNHYPTGWAAAFSEGVNLQRPQAEPVRDRYVYYPDTAAVPESVAVNVRGRSYKIVADAVLDDDAAGVIFAHGSRFGGHALFIQDHELHYVYNFLGIPPEQTFVSEPLTAGPRTLGMEFVREGAGEYKESVGTCRLYVDDRVVAEGPTRAQIGKFTLCGDGLCVGYDSADTVSRQYTNPFPFTGGKLLGVAVDVSGEQYLDLELEAAAMLSRE